MVTEISGWRHVFKLDPNKELSEDALERICESGTNGIIVGGTDNVTMDNVLSLLVRIRRYFIPVALEVSSLDILTPGFDYYFLPTVLNSQNPKWIVGMQQEALKEFGDMINWDEVAVEGYCVLNPEAKVAKVTEAKTDLTKEDVVGYAHLAENFFKLPIFYLEYSGTYGDIEVVRDVKKVLEHTQLFYGGGITTLEKAIEMNEVADTIIVGNIIYEDLNEAIKTVKVIK